MVKDKIRKLPLMFFTVTSVLLGAMTFPAEVKAAVPADAVEFKGNYYRTYAETLTWSEAKAKCEAMGGHLVTITSSEEQAFIESINSSSRWIGGYRDSGNNWKWVTGEKWSYTNWAPNEPNNSSAVVSNENCVAVWPKKWNDMNDGNKSEQSGYICEWETKEELTIVNGDMSIVVGGSYKLDYIYTDVNGNVSAAAAEWSSSDKTVVEVYSDGTIKGKKAGVAKISCKAGGLKKTIRVAVFSKSAPKLSLITRTDTVIKFGWKKQTGVKGYQVWVFDDTTGEYRAMKRVSGKSIHIYNMVPKTEYRFKVSSYIKSGGKIFFGPMSEELKVTTK